jgi:hypothetical protein
VHRKWRGRIWTPAKKREDDRWLQIKYYICTVRKLLQNAGYADKERANARALLALDEKAPEGADDLTMKEREKKELLETLIKIEQKI